ncbi:hypothetical protein, partial [Halomonas sp. NCCP-2165]
RRRCEEATFYRFDRDCQALLGDPEACDEAATSDHPSRRLAGRCGDAFYCIWPFCQSRFSREGFEKPNRNKHFFHSLPLATMSVAGSGCVLYGFPPAPASPYP